ncbi:hypothetical protein MTO96_028775 [Rhipicephalus appendiculatus]
MEAKIAKIKNYSGLCVAPFTPFDGKGNININLIDQYVSLLQKQSVTGAFVNGSTGEGLSLTMAERKKLAERWVEASRGKLDLVIVHVTGSIHRGHARARHTCGKPKRGRYFHTTTVLLQKSVCGPSHTLRRRSC